MAVYSGTMKWIDVGDRIREVVLSSTPVDVVAHPVPPHEEASAACRIADMLSDDPFDGALHGLGKKQLIVTIDQLSAQMHEVLLAKEETRAEARHLIDLLDNGARLNLKRMSEATVENRTRRRGAYDASKQMNKNRKVALNVSFDREGGALRGGPHRTFYKVIMKRTVSRNTTADGTDLGQIGHQYEHEYTDCKRGLRSLAVAAYQKEHPLATHQELEDMLEKHSTISAGGGRGKAFRVLAYDVEVQDAEGGCRDVKTTKYQLRYPASLADPLVALVMRELGEEAVETLRKRRLLTRRSAMQALEGVRTRIEADARSTHGEDARRSAARLRAALREPELDLPPSKAPRVPEDHPMHPCEEEQEGMCAETARCSHEADRSPKEPVFGP